MPGVVMTVTDFLDALEIYVPETRPMVDKHLEVHACVILHVLTADLRRYAIQSLEAGQSEVLGRLLAVVDRARRQGTDDLQNAIAISFVKDTPRWNPATQPFIEAWPARLRAQADRQRGQRQ
jgi:hypothetical protein